MRKCSSKTFSGNLVRHSATLWGKTGHRRPFAQGDWVLKNILYITLISSSGSRARSITNHSQKYQEEDSRREEEKLNSKSIKASKLQISWNIATSSRTQEST